MAADKQWIHCRLPITLLRPADRKAGKINSHWPSQRSPSLARFLSVFPPTFGSRSPRDERLSCEAPLSLAGTCSFPSTISRANHLIIRKSSFNRGLALGSNLLNFFFPLLHLKITSYPKFEIWNLKAAIYRPMFIVKVDFSNSEFWPCYCYCYCYLLSWPNQKIKITTEFCSYPPHTVWTDKPTLPKL